MGGMKQKKRKDYWYLLSLLLLTIAIAASCGGGKGEGVQPAPETGCIPDMPVSSGLFTSPPTAIGNVAGIVPLGNVDSGGHVIPVNHMYLQFPGPYGGGSSSYPVYSMAAGRIFMLERQKKELVPEWDYSVWIYNTCNVSSYLFHFHSLSTKIQDFITTYNIPWQDLSGSGTFWIMLLGQSGAPMLNVAAGEELGIVKNYRYSWDVGVVDKRFTNGTFVNPSPNRYPGFKDSAALFPNISGDMGVYDFLGNIYLNAGCFIDYMSDAGGMKTAWFDRLASTPKSCGKVGWDEHGTLQGVWFNPAIDSLGLVRDYEVAALTIVPDNLNPTTKVQIGWGNASNGVTTPSLAILDPITWSPPISGVTQIKNTFKTVMDKTIGAVVNPDPATVKNGTTVCYDLPYFVGTNNRYNYILFRIRTDNTTMEVKYDPTEEITPKCSTITFPPVDSTWVTYIR